MGRRRFAERNSDLRQSLRQPSDRIAVGCFAEIVFAVGCAFDGSDMVESESRTVDCQFRVPDTRRVLAAWGPVLKRRQCKLSAFTPFAVPSVLGPGVSVGRRSNVDESVESAALQAQESFGYSCATTAESNRRLRAAVGMSRGTCCCLAPNSSSRHSLCMCNESLHLNLCAFFLPRPYLSVRYSRFCYTRGHYFLNRSIMFTA